jgi:hypothetical protein
MRKSVQVLLVLGLAALMALAGAGVVMAQGPKTGGRGAMGEWGGMGDRGAAWGNTHLSSAALDAVAKQLGMTTDELTTQLKGGAVLADLADKAGIDLQKLRDAATAAQTQATKDAIEKAVTDGKLTRAQADWMLQGINQGYTTRGAFPFGCGKGLGATQNNTELAAAAKVLGMTAEQLSTQLWGGRTLAQLAEKAGVKLTDVQSAMQTAQQDARRAAIEQAVKDGRLTQQQADWLLQGLQQGYLGRGGGMFFGGRGHRGLPEPQGGTETPAPSSTGGRFQAPAGSAGQSL